MTPETIYLRFTEENTKGYAALELTQLNRLYVEQGGLSLRPHGEPERVFSERLLTWFDSRPRAD